MKLSRKTRPQSGVRGYTLVEIMIAATVFSLVTLGMVSVQLYGLRAYTLGATKLSATAGGLKALNYLRDQIRASKYLDVGQYTYSAGNLTNFNTIADGSPQIGNALRICTTTNYSSTSIYKLIFLQPSSGTNFMAGNNQLLMLTCSNTTILASNVLANYITNQYCFQAQDFQNNVRTANSNTKIIQCIFQFSEWEYPIARLGTNGADAYSYYQLRTRVARRPID